MGRAVRITTAEQAAARDRDAIASGIASWTLMLAAGTRAAEFIVAHWNERLANGATVYAGSGNNGGDAYVVASRLLEAGVFVRLHAIGEPRTADSKAAREMYEVSLKAFKRGGIASPNAANEVVVDGVLGTGQRGALRMPERDACHAINRLHREGAIVVALDVPSGINATTGEVVAGAVVATHTLSFGTLKRGHVLERAQSGAITVLDIGLGAFAERDDGAWRLADASLLAPLVPRIEWNAYKGTRGRLAIVGGAEGMAGAIVLASRAALRAGGGLVYSHTAAASANALQIAVPQVVARTWPASPENVHAVAIGPGLGRTTESVRVLCDALDATREIPVVLDADALTLLASEEFDRIEANGGVTSPGHGTSLADRIVARFVAITSTRAVVCTPHVGEFARLLAKPVAETLDARIAQATAFANATGAVVLLKGTPTIVIAPGDKEIVVVPRGTSVLATGGSGDLLTGLIVALLAQGTTPRNAAIVGAWIHGRAAELAAGPTHAVRGITLDEVLMSLALAWRELAGETALPNDVLALLPPVA